MASPCHYMPGQPATVLPGQVTGLLTDGLAENVPTLMPSTNMTLPSLVQTAAPPVIKPIMQPHMLNINTTGTSGFRSPSIQPSVNSQPNITFPPLNISQVCVPFPSDAASSGYQFPSPASAGSVQTINNGMVADTAQSCDQSLPWLGVESWNNSLR